MGSSESLNSSVSSSIQQARANSLTKARLMQHNSQQQQQGKQTGQQPSSEYSFASSRTAGGVGVSSSTHDDGVSSNNDYYGVFRVGGIQQQQQQDPIHLSRFKSQPTSPLKEDPHGMAFNQGQQQYASLPMPNKPGSAASTTEADIEKLRRELEDEHDKVHFWSKNV